MSRVGGGGGGGGGASAAGAASSGLVSINDKVDTGKVSSVNATSTGGGFLFSASNTTVLRSDTDSQMILYVSFKETIKLFSITVEAPPEEAPTMIRLYANRASCSFDDSEEDATQVVPLKKEDLGKEIKLKFAKFQAVNHVYLFVDREDSATSAITKIKFIGSSTQVADVSKIKAHDHQEK